MLPLVLAAVGGYLVYDSMKSEKFAKGGGVSQNTPMGIAKMLYNKYDKKERKEFLISAGYSDSVANDLSMESWDSLEKQVHTNLAKVLQSGKRKTYGTYADGGEVDKLRNDIIKLEDYISKLKDVEKYEKEDEEKVITNKETRIFFENKLEKLKKRLEELESE